jgi:hypothetical protein
MASFEDRKTILDGETYIMPQNGTIDIGAVSANVIVSILVGDGTTYREIGTIISGNVMRADFVKGQVIKFTGSNAEITAFG